MSRPSALSCLAFSATTMIALGLARPMRLASWGIAEPQEFGEREAAGGRVAVTRARASQPRDFSMPAARSRPCGRSEEHTSELQSLMRSSYAVFCLKKKNHHRTHN